MQEIEIHGIGQTQTFSLLMSAVTIRYCETRRGVAESKTKLIQKKLFL
jgi:hypothetical protein